MKDPFLLQFWNEIQPIVIHSGSDYWQWTGTSNSFCTFSLAWETIRVKLQLFQFYSLIWIPNSRPKMSICALRALQKKLLTSDFLLSIGVVQAN